MNEYDFDSDENLKDTVDLSDEEMTAAAILGLGSTKRLTKKQYADFKKKAQEMVSKASVPSKTAREAAKGIVKGGGQKSAEVSARTFSKALEKGPIKVPSGSVISDLPQVSGKMGAAIEKARSAAAGVPWSPAEGVIQMSGPPRGSIMDALSKGGQSALSALKKIGVSPAALESAGKFLTKGARVAGPAAAVVGALADLADITSAGEGSDKPGEPLTSKEFASSYPGKAANYIPPSSLKSVLEKQASTPAYDVNTEGEIIKAALSQAESPEYLEALQKRREERDRYINLLKNDSNIVDVEKERLLAAYDQNSPQQRALKDVDSLSEKKASLNQKILEAEAALAGSNNLFSSDRLNKQLASYKKQLADLTSPQDNRTIAAASGASANSILSELEQKSKNNGPSVPSVAVLKPSAISTEDSGVVKTATGTGQPTSTDVAKQDREDELTKVVGQESVRQMTQYEDLMSRLKDAQERQRVAQLGVALGQAGERIGSAIGMVKPGDQSFYEQMAKQAEGITDQFKEEEAIKKEARRNDPNSEESKSARNFAKGLGYPVGDTESAAELEKRFPIMERFQTAKENREARIEQAKIQREAIAATREDTRSENKRKEDTKRLDRLSEKISAGMARKNTDFGAAAAQVSQVKNVEALIKGYKNADDIPQIQLVEVARGLDRVISGGGTGSLGMTRELTPETAKTFINKTIGYITSRQRGAGAGEFIKSFSKILEREKEQALSRLDTYKGEIASSYRDMYLNPKTREDIEFIFEKHGLDADQIFSKKAAKPDGKRDQRIESAAKQAGMTYEQMEQYLKDTGQIK